MEYLAAQGGSARLVCVGLSHQTAELRLRERVAIAPHELSRTLAQLQRYPAVRECAILSTCNRTELYAVTDGLPAAAQAVLEECLLQRCADVASALSAALYAYADTEAAAHLCRVTSGLVSAILGESEIMAQVKHAYQAAHAAGATGPRLHRLFQKALHCAKVVRTRTGIAEGHASVGSAVVALAQRLLGPSLSLRSALLWGAGKAAASTAQHLHKAGIGELWVVSRTADKAQALAERCRGEWLSWESAARHLARADLAVVCTQAPHYVIERGDLEAVRAAGRRPLVLVDLAVPRNIDPAVRSLPGVQLYDVDAVQTCVQVARLQRRESLEDCDGIIRAQVNRWWGATPAACPQEVTLWPSVEMPSLA